MGEFTFLTTRIQDNEVLAELPVESGASVGKLLSGTGQTDCSVKLGDSRYDKLDLVQVTEQNLHCLFVDYDGDIMWGGIIWGRDYDSEAKALKLTAVEFMSYFARRNLTVNSSTLFGITNVDSAQIVRELITWAQAQTHGNMLIQVGSELSHVLVDFDIKAYEYKQITEAIMELAEQDTGFDVSVDCRWDENDRPARYLVIDSPRRGRSFNTTRFMWEKPGNLRKYTYPEDGTSQSTVTHGVGKGEGNLMKRVDASTPGLYDLGYPLLEAVASFKDVATIPRLTTMTASQQSLNRLPVGAMTATVDANAEPKFGTYIDGDFCQFKIADERFPERLYPGGAVLDRRIVGWKATTGSDTVELETEASFA